MYLLPHVFLVACFTLGLALQHYLPTRRRDKRFWIVIVTLIAALYAIGRIYLFPPALSTGFVLSMGMLAGFSWRWTAPITKRYLLPRLRPYMPFIIGAITLIVLAAFVNGNSFVTSAVTVGCLFALFGGLWGFITRRLK